MDTPTFDELRDLAQRDPEGFEVLRAQLIEDCICRSSSSSQRRVAGSPMKALLDIQAMMYDSFLDLKQVLLVREPPLVPLCRPAHKSWSSSVPWIRGDCRGLSVFQRMPCLPPIRLAGPG
ncbi:DUF3135 domain-containing protein [Marinobacter zhanjiangensis]|uniref:DUF3135 domain-containing protein n=1 Tax=Marinobacter zhanjiangensis TaxID=578215 RepID=A0ABQ3AMJ5_9GAMM|nr:hypothetical protein GCM10007071_05110 [Marinobacter zhanjiangensis]